jgi:hypothetical protein
LRYEVTQAPLMIYNCHCTNCQTIGGGAFAVAVTVMETSFAFTKGEPHRFEWSSDAGNRRYGWFCGDCGTRIAHGQIPTIGILSMRGGTLDDTSWVEPVGDIWTRSKQPWVVLSDDRLQVEQQPADYAPFFERFARQRRF